MIPNKYALIEPDTKNTFRLIPQKEIPVTRIAELLTLILKACDAEYHIVYLTGKSRNFR